MANEEYTTGDLNLQTETDSVVRKVWMLLHLAEIGAAIASNEEVDAYTLAYQFKIIKEKLDEIHDQTEAMSSVTKKWDLRIFQFIQRWMQNHDADDQAWLTVQIERTAKEYENWKQQQQVAA